MLGLTASTLLIAPGKSAAALAAMAILLSVLRRRERIPARAAVIVLFAALGLTVSDWHRTTVDRENRSLAATPAGRFTRVRVPLHRGWSIEQRGGASLRAPHFDIITEANGRATVGRINQQITLLAPAAPPFDASSHIEAEGFLDRTESGALMLRVKSARLLTPSGRSSPLDPLSWNRHIAHLFATSVVDERSARGAALAGALLLGRSGELPDDILDAYQHGGTYHLLVFSGLQLAVAAGLIAASLIWLERPFVIDLALLAFSIFIARFIGNDPSVSRSAAMLALFSVSRLMRRPTPIENLFFLSAMLRLLFVPDDLAKAGFLLTYGATGGLILIARPLVREYRVRSTAGRTFLFAATAELTTVPLTLQFFHRYAFGSSLITIILLPPLGAMCALAAAGAVTALAGMPDLTAVLLTGTDRLNDLAMIVNNMIGATRLTGIAVAAPAMITIVSYALFVLITATFTRRVSRLAPLLLLVPLASGLVTAHLLKSVASPQIEVLDVGQGDSILLRSGEASMLVDGGGHPGNLRFGDRVLLPKLIDRGVTHLSVVVLSHPHPDHCGGLPSVLRNLIVDELWIARRHLHSQCAEEMFAAIGDRPVRVRFLDRMDHAQIDRIGVCIWTQALRFKRAPENNSSAVIQASIDGRTLLLTGDIEREAEGRLLDEHGRELRSDVLKVAHHGSRSSSTMPFLAAASPRIALISCGRRNYFGHPHVEVLERLRETHTRVLRTDLDGDIRISFLHHHLFLTTQIDYLP